MFCKFGAEPNKLIAPFNCGKVVSMICHVDVLLFVVEKVRGRMKKTANWDTDIGLNFTLTFTEMGNMVVEKLANKTMRVVTTTNEPYVMTRKSIGPEVTPEALERYSFLERYEGFCVDLIKELAKVVRCLCQPFNKSANGLSDGLFSAI